MQMWEYLVLMLIVGVGLTRWSPQLHRAFEWFNRKYLTPPDPYPLAPPKPSPLKVVSHVDHDSRRRQHDEWQVAFDRLSREGNDNEQSTTGTQGT
jgi:hypothetical protein